MEKNKKHIIKKIEIITYVIIGLLIIGTIVLDTKNYIEIEPGFVFIMFGIMLSPMGIFGIINNEVSFGSAQALKYNKNSIAGKIANVVIVIFGVISFVIGLFALLVK